LGLKGIKQFQPLFLIALREIGAFIIFKALLKLNVDFYPMVIREDMRDSCLEKRVKGDPSGSEAARRRSRNASEKREPRAEINRQY
jgi:hypothetical protein